MSWLYTKDGWINIPSIFKKYNVSKFPFIFLVGGRGTGKTYGILKEYLENSVKFIYMRRTQVEIEACMTPLTNPFKSLNKDLNIDFEAEAVGKNIIKFSDKSSRYSQEILSMALSTVANVRGFDASDYSDIFLDEFIAESHKNQMREEASAFLNAYETVCRNRELLGLPPVRLCCAANSNNLFNPIFLELNVIDEIYNNLKKGQQIIVNPERGFVIIVFLDSPISEMKKETALYRLTKGSKFEQMAIKNHFENQFFSKITHRNLNEYNAVVNLGNFTLYEHKSRQELYVCRKYSKNAMSTYKNTDIDRRRAKYSMPWIWSAYCNEYIYFDSVQLESEFVYFFNFI